MANEKLSCRRWDGLRVLRLLAAVLVASLLCGQRPTLAAAATTQSQAMVDGPVVGGVALETTTAAGWPLHYDRDIPPEVVAHIAAALEASFEAVPRLSGLSPLATPLAVHLLADQQRFRQALAELAGVRIELVGEQIGAYAIQRGDTMLLFFQRSEAPAPRVIWYAVWHAQDDGLPARRPEGRARAHCGGDGPSRGRSHP